ncbi:MAG: serine hydrolase domain-containing protein [Bacteroidales bacterium]
MVKVIFILSILFFSYSAISQKTCQEKEKIIDSLIKSHIVTKGKRPVYSFLVYSKNNISGCEIKNGAGTIGKDKVPVDFDFQFNTASITKTMVATVILQLEEEGKLSITDNAAKYLNDLDFLKFSEIHFFNKQPMADAITIEMLLNHTSGIADIFSDAATRFNISVLTHKKRQFTPEMVMKRYFKYNLNKKAFNKPGQGYHYSDINYMLLGFVIQKITGQSLHEAIRQRILEPLNLKDSYFEFYEKPCGHLKRIDAYLNRINMTQDINTSYEWAGGGIVSTTHDLAVFITTLMQGGLFSNENTIKKMMDTSKSDKYNGNYGLGLIKYKVDNYTFYGHGGFYGSIMVYNPETRLVFCGNIGQAFPPYDSGELAKQMIKIMLSE